MALLFGNNKVINFAICWNSCQMIETFNSKNSISYTIQQGILIPYYTESARDCQSFFSIYKDQTSSSETTSKSSFNTSISPDWKTWFIGFSEGDGAIQTRKKGKQNYFVITQKEKEIQQHIQKVLNIGYVKGFKGYYRFFVYKKSDIIQLYNIFNGNQVLKHRNTQLHQWYNNISSNTISPLPPATISLNNNWLSGFTDAEGCFSLVISKRKESITGFRVHMRYILDQKNEKDIQNEIVKVIGFGNVALRKGKQKSIKSMYRLSIHSFLGLNKIITYQGDGVNSKQKTRKRYDYSNWIKVYNMVTNKEHQSIAGLNKIREIKKTINKGNSSNRPAGQS